MSRESLRREIAFYLLAGAHTSATAFTRCMHNIFKWLDAHPEDADRVRNDRIFVQRATHETIRLQGSSPTSMRWALADIELSSGLKIAEGTASRSTSSPPTEAPTSTAPTPTTSTPTVSWPTASPMGSQLRPGHARLHRSGPRRRAGLRSRATEDDHLFGLVPVAVQTMFDHGCRPDPDNPPEMDESTTRPYFGKYPVDLHGLRGTRWPKKRRC